MKLVQTPAWSCTFISEVILFQKGKEKRLCAAKCNKEDDGGSETEAKEICYSEPA